MKYIYDRQADSLSIIFADGRRYLDSEEIADGVVVDFDTAGKPIAIEFHDRASRFVDTEGLASGREVYVQHANIPADASVIDGSWLRMTRIRLGMTQEQLADVLTVAPNTIARWERGEVKIEHAGMLRLALAGLERSRAIVVRTGTRFPTTETGRPKGTVAVHHDAKSGAFISTKPGAKRMKETKKR